MGYNNNNIINLIYIRRKILDISIKKKKKVFSYLLTDYGWI